jgi:hypothetical protein
MQGLLGRFGKNSPEPVVSPPNSWANGTLSQAEIDAQDYPAIDRVAANDDEETNWDDAEALENENNPIVYPELTVPAITPIRSSTTPDVEDWDEALPAPTVKNSNVEVRRSKKERTPKAPNEDLWVESPANPSFSADRKSLPNAANSDLMARGIGLWSAMLQQLRRILPAPIRRLSDAILTALVVMLVTVGIWFVDGLFAPSTTPSVATPPAAIVAAPTTNPAVVTTPKIGPEQAFIEAIQAQLSEVTSQYPDDIIQTLQVDIPRDRLIVKLNPVWYLIGDEQQNNVTDRMWLQAKENHFTRLELQDPQSRSIARSPVVGQHMIILQRRQSY